MTPVTLSGYIKVPITDLEAVRAELPKHIALTRSEPGCLRFEVEADPTDPTVFHVNEEFSEPLSFTNHQERVRSSKWGTITANVERHYEIAGMPDSKQNALLSIDGLEMDVWNLHRSETPKRVS